MITRHPKTLLVIVAEAALEETLVRDLLREGAMGWTVSDVRGGGSEGVREGAWEADRTIELKVICDAAVAESVAAHVLATHARHYGVSMYFSEVSVLRPEKY